MRNLIKEIDKRNNDELDEILVEEYNEQFGDKKKLKFSTDGSTVDKKLNQIKQDFKNTTKQIKDRLKDQINNLAEKLTMISEKLNQQAQQNNNLIPQ